MYASTSSIIIAILLFCTNVNTQDDPLDHTEGYYWRDYKSGTIPEDAYPGGTNVNGNPTYIGQILHLNLLIPAKIDPEFNKVTYEWGYKEYVTTQNIKILCTKHPERFEWLNSGNGLVDNLNPDTLVDGGFEPNVKIYIGRKQIDNELVLGKIIKSSIQTTLNTSKNGVGTQHAQFQILTYNSNENIKNETNQSQPIDIDKLLVHRIERHNSALHKTLQDYVENPYIISASKVAGGDPISSTKQFPFFVMIVYQGNQGSEVICGGTIVSPTWILTAAHCISRPDKIMLDRKSLSVRAETVLAAGNLGQVQIRKVLKLVVHSRFRWKNGTSEPPYHDIGLIRLDYALIFKDRTIVPATLPKRSQKPPEDQPLIVPGVGFENGLLRQARFIEMPVLQKQECEEIIRKRNFSIPPEVLNKLICTKPTFGQSACQGDSGGPVFYSSENKHYVLGIVSFKEESGCKRDGVEAHMHVDVRKYLDFIYSNVNNLASNFVRYGCPSV